MLHSKDGVLISSASSRSVVRSRARLPHQPPRAESRTPSSQITVPVVPVSVPSDSNGQYYNFVLFEQTGGYPIEASLSRGSDDLEMASHKRLNHCDDPPPGNSQRLGGRTKPRLRRSSRLGSQRLSHSKHFPKLESTRHRPVDRRGKRKMPRLCIQFLPTRLSRECPFDKMVSDITVRLSTTSVDSHSVQQVLQDQHQNDSDSSEWPGQWWYPDLLQLSDVPHKRLPCRPDLLSKSEVKMFHPNLSFLRLTAWLLKSSNTDT